jgi:uncharacterized protein YggE
MSTHTRFGVVIGLFVLLVAGGAAAVVFTPKAAVVGGTHAQPPPVQTLTLAASSTPTTITVVGVGSASAVPDQATIGLGVTATRSDVRSAVNQANADMSHLLSALRSRGVLDKDIQTTSLSIYQQTNCCPQSITGYSSTNQVTVTIHHLININGVIEAAVDSVGNDIQLNGINLSVTNPSGMTSTARSAAMTDALARAQEWARLANHHVGALIGLSEIVGQSTANPCDQGGCGRGAGGGGGIQVLPGQTSIAVTITATYELAA